MQEFINPMELLPAAPGDHFSPLSHLHPCPALRCGNGAEGQRDILWEQECPAGAGVRDHRISGTDSLLFKPSLQHHHHPQPEPVTLQVFIYLFHFDPEVEPHKPLAHWV